MTMTARIVHAAVFMIAVPPAIKMPSVRVPMHVSKMPLAAWRGVDLAVLMITMPPAIQMPAVRIAMHVTVMMMMPVRIGLYVLGLLRRPVHRR